MSDIREDLKAFLDGELAPARASEVEAAIANDPNLRTELEFMRTLGAEIRQIASDPEVLGAQEALARARRRRTFLLDGWILGSTGAAAILLVLTNPLFAKGNAEAAYSDTGAVTANAVAPATSANSPSADRNIGGGGLIPKPDSEPRAAFGLGTDHKAESMPEVQQSQGFAQQRAQEETSTGRAPQDTESPKRAERGQLDEEKGKERLESKPVDSFARRMQQPASAKSQDVSGGVRAKSETESGRPPVAVPPKPQEEKGNSIVETAAQFLLVRSPVWAPIMLFGWLMSWRARRS